MKISEEQMYKFILGFICFISGSIVCFMIFDPITHVSQAQKTILANVVDAYCNYNGPTDFRIGRMALAAKIASQANLGPLAWIEIMKCKATRG